MASSRIERAIETTGIVAAATMPPTDTGRMAGSSWNQSPLRYATGAGSGISAADLRQIENPEDDERSSSRSAAQSRSASLRLPRRGPARHDRVEEGSGELAIPA